MDVQMHNPGRAQSDVEGDGLHVFGKYYQKRAG